MQGCKTTLFLWALYRFLYGHKLSTSDSQWLLSKNSVESSRSAYTVITSLWIIGNLQLVRKGMEGYHV